LTSITNQDTHKGEKSQKFKKDEKLPGHPQSVACSM
jgi:hypothetical protein